MVDTSGLGMAIHQCGSLVQNQPFLCLSSMIACRYHYKYVRLGRYPPLGPSSDRVASRRRLRLMRRSSSMTIPAQM
jgi:hypothetical protein